MHVTIKLTREQGLRLLDECQARGCAVSTPAHPGQSAIVEPGAAGRDFTLFQFQSTREDFHALQYPEMLAAAVLGPHLGTDSTQRAGQVASAMVTLEGQITHYQTHKTGWAFWETHESRTALAHGHKETSSCIEQLSEEFECPEDLFAAVTQPQQQDGNQ